MPSNRAALRILITCRELAVRAGTQLYTRDIAQELARRGHEPVVYSPRTGAVADELRAAGVTVIDSLDELREQPDVIHGQHHLETMAAVTRLPNVPAIFVCHGVTAWHETPPKFPSIRHYVAVDDLRRTRILSAGVHADSITTIHNFVDLDRFRDRGEALPERPTKALLFSNQAAEHGFAETLRRVCSARGITLDIAGTGFGNTVASPEKDLARYHLVFGRGRCALEAMATGAAVILCDIEGSGPFVTPENYHRLSRLNFGVGALEKMTSARIAHAIDQYDALTARATTTIVRKEHSLTDAVTRLLETYDRAIEQRSALASDEYTSDCLAAASAYLVTLTTSADQEARKVAALLARTHDVLQTLERSPLLRLRRMLVQVPGATAAYQLLARKPKRFPPA